MPVPDLSCCRCSEDESGEPLRIHTLGEKRNQRYIHTRLGRITTVSVHFGANRAELRREIPGISWCVAGPRFSFRGLTS